MTEEKCIEVSKTQRQAAQTFVALMWREYNELEEDGKIVFIIEMMRQFKNELVRIKAKI